MYDQRWSTSPSLGLHGDEDDWVPLSLVEGLVEDIRSHGANIEVHVYTVSYTHLTLPTKA